MKKIFLPLFAIAILSFSCSKKATITPYEFALLSSDVYDDETTPLPDHLEPFLDFEEKDNSINIDIDLSNMDEIETAEEVGDFIMKTIGSTLGRGGYFGRAYVNENKNQLIIAHRGTDLDREELKRSKSSWKRTMSSLLHTVKDLDDDYAIFKGEIPQQQYEAAEKFTQQAIDTYFQQYSRKPKIIHTGHSLGAVLAELCAAKNNCKAVTFESPGTKPLIRKLLTEQKVNWKKLDITSYNAEPNKINSLHEHAGEVIPLYNNKQTNPDYFEINAETLDLHSIKNVLQRFDPVSGKPKI